jgi:ABC-2 type transport system ATP-binding protein
MYVAIETEQLSKRALDDVTLHVEEGEVFAFLTGEGGGKTTLVQILSGRLRPDGGWARVAGVDVADRPEEVRARTGVTLAEAALDAMATGRRHLEVVGALWGLSRRAASDRADELLQLFQLTEVADLRRSVYPRGLGRRLDLAAALVGSPQVLVLDEPTAGLGADARRQVWEELWRLRAGGTTVFLATAGSSYLSPDAGRQHEAGTPHTHRPGGQAGS